jgi:hypothetical protein
MAGEEEEMAEAHPEHRTLPGTLPGVPIRLNYREEALQLGCSFSTSSMIYPWPPGRDSSLKSYKVAGEGEILATLPRVFTCTEKRRLYSWNLRFCISSLIYPAPIWEG